MNDQQSLKGFKSLAGFWGKRALKAGVLLALAGAGGCVVRAGYEPPPYYYRTRLVYTPEGPMYVRERVYYGPYSEAPVYAPPPPQPVAIAPPPSAPPPGTPQPYPPPVAESPAAVALHPLVAPIALYPDPLVAVVLPAATFPQQLQDANAWLRANPQPTAPAIDAQPWAPSVKAVIHYPTVFSQLINDMQWTQSLGAAFLNQPADVMAAIQDMRAQAAAQATLPIPLSRWSFGTALQSPSSRLTQTPSMCPPTIRCLYMKGITPSILAPRPTRSGLGSLTASTGAAASFSWATGTAGTSTTMVIGAAITPGGVMAIVTGSARDDTAQPPRIEGGRYAMSRGVSGRESEIHRSMTVHAPQRQAYRRSGRSGPIGAHR